MNKASFGLAMLMAVGFSGSVHAQTALVDLAAIAAACSGTADTCQAVVARQIATLRTAGLTPDQINTQVAVVSAAVVSASAAAATPAARASAAAALTTAAAASTSPQQRESIATAAGNVASGVTTPSEAVAATPESFSAT